MLSALKIVPMLILCTIALILSADTTQAHDIAAGQTAVFVTDQMSIDQCVSVAHQVCDQVFGSCAKNNEAALGGTYGYQFIYQCHYVKRARGSDISLVIAGSRTADTEPAKLGQLIRQSHRIAGRLMY